MANITKGQSLIIDGHRYYAREWFANKKEAQARAAQMRATGRFLNVRVIRRLADRRYAVYWVFNR